MTTKITGKITAIVMCLFVLSCKHSDGHKYHSVSERIEVESAHYKSVAVSSAQFNETVKTIKITEGDFEFLIPDRKSQLTAYNCAECHNQPLKSIKNTEVGKKAHWDIELNHADDTTMNCMTCHSENNMDNLHSLTNQTIDLNYSHKLCSQCHQKEFKDWKGGAHGKQIGGWAPPRVSNTCVNCHNPHKPHFEKRWPVRFNTEKVKERQ